MTGKGRNGPRERQTMSGILGEQREATRPSLSSAVDNLPRTAAPPPSVIVDQQLSLWERMVSAAEREFEKDDSPAAESAPEGGRGRDGR